MSQGQEAQQPWKALGISRATYFRRKRTGQLPPVAEVAEAVARQISEPPEKSPTARMVDRVAEWIDLALDLSVASLQHAKDSGTPIHPKLALQLSNPIVRLAAAKLEAEAAKSAQAIEAAYEVSDSE